MAGLIWRVFEEGKNAIFIPATLFRNIILENTAIFSKTAIFFPAKILSATINFKKRHKKPRLGSVTGWWARGVAEVAVGVVGLMRRGLVDHVGVIGHRIEVSWIRLMNAI